MNHRNITPPWLVRIHHRLRSASFATVMVVAALHLYGKGGGVALWLVSVFVFLVYPQLLYLMALRSPRSVTRELQNLTIDAGLLGLCMALLAFPGWLSVGAIIAALVNSAINLGWSGVGKAVLASAAGMAAGWLITGGAVEPETGGLVTVISILGLAGYLVAVGNVGYVRNRQLRQMRENLRQRETDLVAANARLYEQLREIEALQQQLHEQAVRDPLTALANRRFFDSVIEREAARALRDDEPLALLMVDVDHFKNFNDSYGHQAGDECLRAIAGCLRAAARRGGDLAARYGGEEFCLVLVDTDAVVAGRLAERLRQSVAALDIVHSGSPLARVTVSIGVAVMPAAGINDASSLLRAADRALYQAKQDGRDRVTIDPDGQRAGELRAGQGLVRLNWHPMYETGLPGMDEQHRALFGLINRLLGEITAAVDVEAIADQAEALLAAVDEHCRDEEAVMAGHGYPGLAEHAALHRELLGRAAQLAEDCRAGRCDIGEMFEFLAQKLIVRHILGSDRDYAEFIARGGGGGRGPGDRAATAASL